MTPKERRDSRIAWATWIAMVVPVTVMVLDIYQNPGKIWQTLALSISIGVVLFFLSTSLTARANLMPWRAYIWLLWHEWMDRFRGKRA